ETVDQTRDHRRQTSELLDVGGGETIEQAPTLAGEVEAHNPSILVVDDAPDETALLGPVDELHHTVVPEQQVLGYVTDRGLPRSFVPSNGEKQLVLLPGEPSRCRLLVAPAKEAAQAGAEGQQLPILAVAESHRRHRVTPTFASVRRDAAGTTTTGHGAWCTTRLAASAQTASPSRLCGRLAITIKSASSARATSATARAWPPGPMRASHAAP